MYRRLSGSVLCSTIASASSSEWARSVTTPSVSEVTGEVPGEAAVGREASFTASACQPAYALVTANMTLARVPGTSGKEMDREPACWLPVQKARFPSTGCVPASTVPIGALGRTRVACRPDARNSGEGADGGTVASDRSKGVAVESLTGAGREGERIRGRVLPGRRARASRGAGGGTGVSPWPRLPSPSTGLLRHPTKVVCRAGPTLRRFRLRATPPTPVGGPPC